MEVSGSMPVARGLGAPSIALDAAGLIAEDIPCRRCGYNLRTLSPEAKCPECGTSISRSVHGDLLRFADPEWVRKLATGALIVVVGICTALAGWILLSFLVYLQIADRYWFRALAVLYCAIILAGAWRATSPDPSSMQSKVLFDSRKLLRISYVFGLCLLVANWSLDSANSFVTETLDALSLLNNTFLAVVVFTFGRSIALRLPDEKLARSCRILLFAFVAEGVANGATWVLVVATDDPFPMTVIMLVNTVILGFSFICMVWSLVIFFRFWMAIKKASFLANDFWKLDLA